METAGAELQPAVRRVRSVTLAPGTWVYVCPCGFRYRAARVARASGQHACYCFKCKSQEGKHYKVMDERIEYKRNPNGTLNCECFPLLRLAHPVRNAVGAVKRIYLAGVWKGDARVEHVATVTLDGITPAMSLWLAAVEPEALRRSVREAYKSRPGIDWRTQPLDFMVLRFLKESREPTLF